MANMETIERLETRLVQLVDGMLAQKSDQMDFLIGLNRLDDILVDHQQGNPINEDVLRFFEDYRHWRNENILKKGQRSRLGTFLGELHQALQNAGDSDSQKLADEVNDWHREIGTGVRLTLKRPKEQASLADRFRIMMTRENEEIEMLIQRHDHLLTCLDDALKSAEAKSDPMYKHLAASIIYFLKIEGYKVDPYVRRLRQINAET